MYEVVLNELNKLSYQKIDIVGDHTAVPIGFCLSLPVSSRHSTIVWPDSVENFSAAPGIHTSLPGPR
jgi:hypothetical protein